MTDIDWPVLWIEPDDGMPQIGTPNLEWQGKPLTFPTMDEWRLSMGRDNVATLTVQIPVIVCVGSPAEHEHAFPLDVESPTCRCGAAVEAA